jgi:NAD(P)-dependent dehydrogenase (short-subunit alcohol dehydrogenase family)
MRMQDKVVVIPGVGGGMGTAVARLCAREGAKLLLVARREGPLQELAEQTRRDGGEAAIFTADAATEDGANAMIQAAVDEYGRIDALYSNLGDYAHGELASHETGPDEWDYLLDVNLRAHYLTARAAITQMLTQEPSGGSIVLAAASRDVLQSANVGYATAKAGLYEFTRRTAREYRNANIRINCIAPGQIGGEPPPDGPLGNPPFGIHRPAASLDVGYAGLYLLSDESNWITGQVLPVDGGRELFPDG